MPRIVVALIAAVLVVPIIVFLAAVFLALLLSAGWIAGIRIMLFAFRQWRKNQSHPAIRWLRRNRTRDDNILRRRQKLEREYEARLKRRERQQPEEEAR
jgi:hypothetical protein